MQSEEGTSAFRLYSLILLMVSLWAANFIFGKIVLREMPPLLVMGWRMVLAGLMMVPVYLLHVRKTRRPGFSWQELPLLLALGLLGVGLNQLLFVNGLSRTSVAHAAIMIGLQPMSVIVLTAITGQERMNAVRALGMALALGGVAVLQFGGAAASKGVATPLGDLLVFLAGFTFACFTVAGKATMGRVGGVVVNAVAYVGTAVVLLPTTVWYSQGFDYGAITWQAWASLFYMALCPSVIAYLIFYWALARIPASRLSAFSYLQPLLATLLAIPFLGEFPNMSLALGGALVLAGVFVAERL